MEIKENNTNHYTKELNSLDRYLLRIVRRYFDLEQINNASSINAMIAEAISRYKSELDYKDAGVTIVNGKVGITNLNIRDLKGEPKFDKNTAYNKNFGSTTDTICEGDDERLFNKRTPTEHNHKNSDVTELKEKIDLLKKELVYYGNHIHVNKAIINKLVYTGTKTSIDLNCIDNVLAASAKLIHELDAKEKELEYIFNSNKSLIDDVINEIYLFMERIYNYITDMDEILNQECVNYYFNKEKALNTIKDSLINFPYKNDINKIINILNTSYGYSHTEQIHLIDMFNSLSSDVNDLSSAKDMFNNAYVSGIRNETCNFYDNDNTRFTFDNSIRCNVNEDEFLMYVSPIKYKNYVHEVTLKSTDADNDVLSVLLCYEQGKYFDYENFVAPLSLNICLGSDEITGLQHNISVTQNYKTPNQYEIAFDDTFVTSATAKWSDYENGIRIRIEKTDSIFKIYRSELNSNILNNTPCIVFDLNDYVEDTETCIGYGCYSQINSSFEDIFFKGYRQVDITENVYTTKDLTDSNDIEIKAELVYNNTKIKLPYITNDFVLDAGISNDKLYARVQVINPCTLSCNLTSGDINFNIYKKLAIETLE